MIGKTNISGGAPLAAQIEIITGVTQKTIEFKFVPSQVILFITKYTGEMQSQCVQKFKQNGNWVNVGTISNIHNYYSGSGGSNFGTISAMSDTSATVSGLTAMFTYYFIAFP